MSLYKHIAGVYDELFPLNQACIEALDKLVPAHAINEDNTLGATAATHCGKSEFVNSAGDHHQRRVLDLGCATGTLISALEARGWETLGIELDPEMVARAHGNVIQGSLLEADRLVYLEYAQPNRSNNNSTSLDNYYDAVLCLGNTLPHIKQSEYEAFFTMVSRLLADDGLFIIQTLNYSHPSVKPGFVFPPIAAKNVIFNRKYEEGKPDGTLTFATDIEIDGRHYHDITTLYPVKPETLDKALKRAGFGSIRHYAGWDLATFNQNLDFYSITLAEKT